MGLIDKYYAGQDDTGPFKDQPVKILIRPWYYPLIVIAFWGSMPWFYIGSIFVIILAVARGDIELPPDTASHVSFWTLAAAYLLAFGAALYFSLKWCFT